MRLILLSIAGFLSLIGGLVLSFLLVWDIHLPDGQRIALVMAGGFGLAIPVVLLLARWLERNDTKKEPGMTLLGVTIPDEVYPVSPELAVPPEPRAGVEAAHRSAPLAEQIREELRLDRPAPRPHPLWLLALSVLFAVTAGVDTVPETLVLVGVVLFHELGHWFAMRAVGYRDVRIFFVPFFGAITSARRQSRPVAPWQRVAVSLAGPLPGLVLVFAWLVMGTPEGLARQVIWITLALNVFNLLPIEQLDGGRVIGELLASRAWWMEATFAVLSSLAFLALGAAMSWMFLAFLGGMSLSQLPRRKRAHDLIVRVRSRWVSGPEAVASPEELPAAALHELAGWLDPFIPPEQRQAPRYATEVRATWQRATQREASGLATVGLLAVYAVSCLGALLTLVLWSLRGS